MWPYPQEARPLLFKQESENILYMELTLIPKSVA